MEPGKAKYNSGFASEIAGWLDAEAPGYRHLTYSGFDAFCLSGKEDTVIICIDLHTWAERAPAVHPVLSPPPAHLQLLVIWEDVWHRKKAIVKSRLRALSGLSVRIPARLTQVRKIDKPTADSFLDRHHMNGSTAARYRFGLFLPGKHFGRLPADLVAGNREEILLAVAAFAAPKIFRRDETPYKSGELIRFANHSGTTVVGGLSKLTTHFARTYLPDDIMTYADLEWSAGPAFQKAGFTLSGQTPPITFLIDPDNFNRYPLHRLDNKIIYSASRPLISITNAGSLKYVKQFQHAVPLSAMVSQSAGKPPEGPPYDLIVVAGPTASGKTALAVRIAYELGGEIISLDSRQVFKGMDIGSGKDLNEYHIGDRHIPYHLIDLLPPGSPYNVHKFKSDFREVFESLQKRRKPVIACGGSGLYIQAVLNMLAADKNPAPSILIIGLHPPAETRRKRIETRLMKRLEEGMLEEVQNLLRDGIPEEVLIGYGLEYKYLTLHLLGKLTYNEMVSILRTEIIQFSKRQVTFLKKIERNGHVIRWL